MRQRHGRSALNQIRPTPPQRTRAGKDQCLSMGPNPNRVIGPNPFSQAERQSRMVDGHGCSNVSCYGGWPYSDIPPAMSAENVGKY